MCIRIKFGNIEKAKRYHTMSKTNKLSKLKPALCFIMAAVSACALCLSLKTVHIFGVDSALERMLFDFQKSFSGNNLTSVLLFGFLTAFYYKYSFGESKLNQKIWVSLISALFAGFMVIGKSFDANGGIAVLLSSGRSAVKAMIVFVGFVILFYNLSNFFISLFKKPSKSEEKGKFPQWSARSFWACTGIIFACWLVYLIIFFPGTSGQDVSNQIKEFYGFPDFFYRLSENKVSDTVFLTDHHPVAHTILIGIFMKIGELFGYQNIGLYLLTILQTLATCMTFAFSVCYLAKRNVPKSFLKISLALYALNPVFPLMAINLSKNSFYAFWFVLYLICFFQYVEEPKETSKSVWWNILLVVSVICQMLFLKYGVYVVLVSGVYLIIQLRHQWKTLVPALLIPVLLFETVYTNMLLPACGVSPGSTNEMLSVPFQQTARYVRDHGDDVTPEEKELLSKMFIYEKLPKEYDPMSVDDVKWNAYRFNNGVSKVDYLKVWFKQFLRHPMCYVEATANNVYGYFYPLSAMWFYYDLDGSCRNWKELDGIVNIGSAGEFESERGLVAEGVQTLEKTPAGYFLMNGMFYMWTCMFMCIVLLAAKKYKYLAVMVPTAVTALFCILSPVNAHSRYFLPIVYATLFSVGMTLYACKNDKDVQEEKQNG